MLVRNKKKTSEKEEHSTVNGNVTGSGKKINIGDYVIFKQDKKFFPGIFTGIVAEKGSSNHDEY